MVHNRPPGIPQREAAGIPAHVPRETRLEQRPFWPAAGVLCERCGAVHDLLLCNDHRKGDPPSQCRRVRPRDVDLCWFHVKQTLPADLTRRPNARRDPVGAERGRVEELTASISQVLDEPEVAQLLELIEPPTPPTPPVSRETAPSVHLEPWTPQPGAGVGSPSPAARRAFIPLAESQLEPIFDPTAVMVDNPVLDLAKVAGILRHAFKQAGHRVNMLSSVSVETRAGGEQLRGEILLWERLLNHLRGVLVDMAKLNLEERLVRIDEVRADRVAEALFWCLGSLQQRLELDRARSELAEEVMRATVHRIVTMGTALDSTPQPALIRP